MSGASSHRGRVLVALACLAGSAEADGVAEPGRASVSSCHRATDEALPEGTTSRGRPLDRSERAWLAFEDATGTPSLRRCAARGAHLLDVARTCLSGGDAPRALAAYEGVLSLGGVPPGVLLDVVNEMTVPLSLVGRLGDASTLARTFLSRIPERAEVPRARLAALAVRLADMEGDDAAVDRIVDSMRAVHQHSRWAAALPVLADSLRVRRGQPARLSEDALSWADEVGGSRVVAAAHSLVALRVEAAEPSRAIAEAERALAALATRRDGGPEEDSTTLLYPVARASIMLGEHRERDLVAWTAAARSAMPVSGAAVPPPRGGKPASLAATTEARLDELRRRALVVDSDYGRVLADREGYGDELAYSAWAHVGALWEAVAREVERSPAAATRPVRTGDGKRAAEIRHAALTDARARARGAYVACATAAASRGFSTPDAVRCEVGLERVGAATRPALEELVPDLLIPTAFAPGPPAPLR